MILKFIYCLVLLWVAKISAQDEGCLPYDSPPPQCIDYVDPAHGWPVFIEHVYNCSRFWVCKPDLTDCLFECAPMVGGSLYFDVSIQYPDGPVCNYPSVIDCENKPYTCQCEVWQDCIDGYLCTPDCKLDTHCNDDEYCDYPDGGEGICWKGCRNNSTCEGCGTCVNHLCDTPECCTNSDCPVGNCVDNFCTECSADVDCPGCATCDNNVCSKPECCDNSDCPVGVCLDNFCVGCSADSDCPGCATCDGNECSNPECCIDSDCLNSQYCESDNTCQKGCRTDSDCPMECDACKNHQCSNPECCKDSDCLDTEICGSDNTCQPGCRDDSMCPGYDAVCDLQYTNCNYCDNIDNEPGQCHPGCADNSNCPGGAVCNGDHLCVTEGDPLLEEIIITTNTCKGCQGTAVEDGVMLHIIGGEGVDGQVTCNSDPLDNKAVVDYKDGNTAIFNERETIGNCYKANLLTQITEGTITWTATKGDWTPARKLVEFEWTGAARCTYACCLSQATLSPANPTANLINCGNDCNGDKTC